MSSEEQSRPLIVVTGGSGFVGQHVVRHLLSMRYHCVVLDQREPEDADLQDRIQNGQLGFVRIDLANETDLLQLPKYLNSFCEHDPATGKPERKIVLVHMASRVDSSRAFTGDMLPTVHVYLHPAMHLVRALEGMLESVCFISTVETYGWPQYVPMDEQHPTNPFNLYGVGKLMTEDFLRIRCSAMGIPLTVFRLSHVYGQGENTENRSRSLSKRA
jgi:UDP-glucose 4-epimerase